MQKIAITGHRKLLNEREVQENISHCLLGYKTTYKNVLAISALAAGTDTVFAEEALKLDIPVRYILPFELSEYELDFSASELSVLHHLLNQHNNEYEELTHLTDDSQDTRNEAYLAVGKYLVDECDILVAVWDGKSAQGKGGTGDVVEYAKESGKEVVIIKAIR
ncbi:MAG: hypothetical protein QE277_13055 [Flectobacillus sp.]|nr:hypothetical protein [Flectobacillus sp.]